MNRIFTLLTILLIFSASRALAVPSITAATATDTVKGASVTITGSGFGSKNPAEPLIWADGEGNTNNPSPKGQITSWETRIGVSAVSSGTMIGDSVHMYRGRVDSTFFNPHFTHEGLGVLTTVFMRLDRRYSFSSASLPGSDNHKNFRINPADSYGGPTNDYVVSAIDGDISFNECNTGYANRYSGGISWDANDWRNEQWLWMWSGTATHHVNGNLRFQQTDVPNCSQVLQEISVADNLCSDCPSSDSSIWMDNIYVDTTAARVMLSTASTIAAAKNLRPCLPQTWASGQVVCEITMGDIPAGSSLYVYLWNSANEVNANGFQITATAASPTSLSPSLGSATQSSLVGSWTDIGGGNTYIGVLASDSGFTSIVSSGAATTPKTYSSLSCGQQYHFQVKISTEGDGSYTSNQANATTSACSTSVEGLSRSRVTNGVMTGTMR